MWCFNKKIEIMILVKISRWNASSWTKNYMFTHFIFCLYLNLSFYELCIIMLDLCYCFLVSAIVNINLPNLVVKIQPWGVKTSSDKIYMLRLMEYLKFLYSCRYDLKPLLIKIIISISSKAFHLIVFLCEAWILIQLYIKHWCIKF